MLSAADATPDVEVRAQVGQERPRSGLLRLARVRAEPTRADRCPEEDVLRGGQVGKQAQLLLDHRDAGTQSAGRMLRNDRAVVEAELALVAADQPGEAPHQRGLARAVLAHERVDLTAGEREVDACHGVRRTEGLADPDG